MTYRIERLMGGAWFVVGFYAAADAEEAIDLYCGQNGLASVDLGDEIRAIAL